jgi:1-acyl-sn-glycerol-3-phosphate acyltransferase
VLVLPIMHVVFQNSASRNSKVRWIINKYFIFFVRLMVVVGVIRVKIYGADQLKNLGPMMVIANHPSYLDIVILLRWFLDAVLLTVIVFLFIGRA